MYLDTDGSHSCNYTPQVGCSTNPVWQMGADSRHPDFDPDRPWYYLSAGKAIDSTTFIAGA